MKTCLDQTGLQIVGGRSIGPSRRSAVIPACLCASAARVTRSMTLKSST